MARKKLPKKIKTEKLYQFFSEKTTRKTNKRLKEKIKKEIIELENMRTDKVIRYKHPKTKKVVEYTRKNVRAWNNREIISMVKEDIINNKPDVLTKTNKYTVVTKRVFDKKQGKKVEKTFKQYIWRNKLTGKEYRGKEVGKKIRSIYKKNIINQIMEQKNVSRKQAEKLFQKETLKKGWTMMIKKYTPSK